MLAGAAGLVCQQLPKTDHLGNSVSVVLNASKEVMTIEYHTASEWRQLKLDAARDSAVTGDRIRVSTTRTDNAIITVDLPIEAGKKYRLAWNSKSSMWDFSPAK